MISISSIITAIEKVTTSLPSGVSLSSLAGEVETGIAALKSNSEQAILNGVESLAEDAITEFVPGGALLLEVIKLVSEIPGFAPADWYSPIRKAQTDNPYDSNFVEGGAGGGE